MSLALGLLIGLLLGLTGAGGSIIAVPLLMASQDWTLTQASPVALLAVAAAGAVGTFRAWQHNLVRYRAATLVALVGVIVTPFGVRLAVTLPPAALAAAFALVLLAVAVRMVIQARSVLEEVSASIEPRGSAGEAVCRIDPQSGRIHWTSRCASRLALTGAIVGILSGMLGVGGGFLVVPALRRFTQLTIHGAVATSLMVVTLVSGGAVIAHLLHGHRFPIAIALPFVLGTVVGMLCARLIAPRVSGARLQQAFAFSLVIVSGLMLAGASGRL